jgi:hypothetical protein
MKYNRLKGIDFMETKKTENNIKNNSLQAQKKRGRPKGSKNTTKRKDHDIDYLTEPGENAKMINYTIALSGLPKIDYNDITQVKNRIHEFYNISAEYDYKLTVAALALSFGINRITLFNWLTGKTETVKNRECLNAIKAVYDTINTQYELLMNNGKINPVSGIFLMKNNLGYKDTTDHVITANNEPAYTLTDITEKAGLLED